MIRFIYLGNIKWGFSDGLRPIPVEKVQSKWDFEHELKSRGNMGSSTKLDEFVPTSKVVSWPKVDTKFISDGSEARLGPFLEGSGSTF